MDPIPLGPFDVLEPIGRGAMSAVWRGVHERLGVPVAVKLLTSELARRAEYGAAFRNEVRAVAGLDHPGIVTLYDHGVLPQDAADRFGGGFEAGTPFLIMELVEGGTLRPLAGRLSWPELQGVLWRLLDALAHAHARGVIHRDIKPANVLLVGEPAGRLKITDFGIAHAGQHRPGDLDDGSVVGTPNYMAPEQIYGRWRDQGPWTDLYSVGCLGYTLAAGRPPFESSDERKILRAHLRERPPPYTAKQPTPPGFRAWLDRLLEKEPDRRYQRAADAAAALRGLSPEGAGIVAVPLRAPREGQAIIEPATDPAAELAADTRVDDAWIDESLDPESTITDTPCGLRTGYTPALVDRDAPPLPADWRLGPRHQRSTLLGVGLGLFGLRQVPLVGRPAARDRLWALLRRVHEQSRPQLVVLEGPTGFGKSRLARWLCETADEVGGAVYMRALNAPHPGPAEGLGPMLGRYLRCDGLDREAVQARVDAQLRRWHTYDFYESRALTELICPTPVLSGSMPGASIDALDPGRVRFSKPAERHALIARFLQAVCRTRALVLWIEDVQWSSDATAFAGALLELDPPPPILILMTARDIALAGHTAEHSQLAALVAQHDATLMPIGPLPPEAHSELVHELLGLDRALAAQVEARTAGNPLFAVQLVGDWVDRDLLEHTHTGFRLRDGVEASLPDDLHALWSARLQEVLRARGERVALELAAVLGDQVDAAEWRAACACSPHLDLAGMGQRGPGDQRWLTDLVERLLDGRLATSSPRGPGVGWSFFHRMLRESLERSARDAGRLADHHRACASALVTRAGPDVPERRGRHLLAAEDHEAALAPLAIAVQGYIETSDFHVAARLLEEWERAWEALVAGGIASDEDPRQAEGARLKARLQRDGGDLTGAQETIERTLVLARTYGWMQALPELLLGAARVAVGMGELRHAAALLEEAEQRAMALGNLQALGRIRHQKLHNLRFQGDLADALEIGQLALEDCEVVGSTIDAAHCLRGVGNVLEMMGLYEEATEHLERARRAFERAGSRYGVALCLNDLGEIARRTEDMDRAEQLYRESLQIDRAIASGNAETAEINLCLCLVARGRWGEAEASLLRLRRNLAARKALRALVVVHAGLMATAAGGRHWDDFWVHHERTLALLQETGTIDLDVAEMAYYAGRTAEEARRIDAARRAYQMAALQWRGMSDDNRAAHAEAALARVGGGD